MTENNEDARRQARAEANDHRPTDDSSQDGSHHSSDVNAANQASQSDDAIIDDSKVPYEDEGGNDMNEGENNTGKDRDRWTPENGAEFNDDDIKYTTLDSGYSEEDRELDSLFNPIDDRLRDLNAKLQDNHRELRELDTKAPDALGKMRDILLRNNDIEKQIAGDLKLLETHSVDYQNIKDRLLPEDGKKWFQRLKPLFDISDKKQMNTFVGAFYNINRIEKEGYLKNLLDLATFFKEHKREILGDDDKSGGQDGTHDE